MATIAAGPNLSAEIAELLAQWGWRFDPAAPIVVDSVVDSLEFRFQSSAIPEDRIFLPLEGKQAEFEWRTNYCYARLNRLAKQVHDLRSPLNAIHGYAEMIIETTDGDAVRFASKIRTAAELLTVRLESFRTEGV
jgi:signal transduction histidine kinase